MKISNSQIRIKGEKNNMITVVQLGLGALMLAYLGVFFQDVWKHRSEIHSDGPLKNFINVAQGYITNFLDTLGIGSFAPQTIIYKTFHLVKDDSNVPGTLNVANTIPVMFEGFIFLTIVEVEAFTLIVLIIASIIGGIAGAKVVSKLPVKKVQLVITTALALTAILMACVSLVCWIFWVKAIQRWDFPVFL